MTTYNGFECQAVSKKSKNGKDYICLEVSFPNGYKKTVFLEQAEVFMLLALTENFGKE